MSTDKLETLAYAFRLTSATTTSTQSGRDAARALFGDLEALGDAVAEHMGYAQRRSAVFEDVEGDA